MDDCFTICQYKSEEPRNNEISTSFSLDISLFWFEIGMLSQDSK